MDYCSSCRRHLNGALVCPGCGAYAPDIAPVTAGGHTVPATSTGAGTPPAWDAAPVDTWHDDRPHATAGGAAITAAMSEYPRTDPGDDLVPVPSAPQGRAARRRQRARWKKNQRRAVVATAVALVGGGLTVSVMDQQSGDRAQAATAPESAGADTDIAEKPSTPPSRTRPDSGASSPTSSAPERPSRQRTAAPPQSTPSNLQPDAAAPPRSTTSEQSAPQSQTTSPSAEDAVSGRNEAQPSQTPTPSATEPSSQPPQTSPAPTATSPSQICLLVVCLG
ncbi:SCO2400 family protein [Streptomyces phaeochromogenes]